MLAVVTLKIKVSFKDTCWYVWSQQVSFNTTGCRELSNRVGEQRVEEEAAGGVRLSSVCVQH